MAHQIQLTPLRVARFTVVEMFGHGGMRFTCMRRQLVGGAARFLARGIELLVTGSIVVCRVGSGVFAASPVSRPVQAISAAIAIML